MPFEGKQTERAGIVFQLKLPTKVARGPWPRVSTAPTACLARSAPHFSYLSSSMVCCHHIISARRFCLTSEVNGRRSAERARVESSRVESRVEFGCQAAARECQAQRLPQQPPCHMHPAFTAATAAATQQRSPPHIAAAAHCRLVWLSSARNQVESETRASAVALPIPHPRTPRPSSRAPLPLCGALLMWPRPRPRPHLDIIVIGLGFSFGCVLRSFRFVAGRAAAAG